MKTLCIFDSKNYIETSPRFMRNAVRGIIIKNNKIALIRSQKYGEYKFPGGGIEEGESHIETLIRETKEETGLTVIPSSIMEYGMTKEIRKGAHEYMIFEQNSYYYFCDVEDYLNETMLNTYEAEFGYQLKFVTLKEAVEVNEAIEYRYKMGWIKRETYVLKELYHQL